MGPVQRYVYWPLRCRAIPGASGDNGGTLCATSLPIGTFENGDADLASALVTGSEVERWGLGVVQEIDSAAMHLFARWQHLDLDLDATDTSSHW